MKVRAEAPGQRRYESRGARLAGLLDAFEQVCGLGKLRGKVADSETGWCTEHFAQKSWILVWDLRALIGPSSFHSLVIRKRSLEEPAREFPADDAVRLQRAQERNCKDGPQRTERGQ